MHFLERDERRALKFEKFLLNIQEPSFAKERFFVSNNNSFASSFAVSDNCNKNLKTKITAGRYKK